VFVNDFIRLVQLHSNARQVHHILANAINDGFHPNDASDSPACREPVSLKKLQQGDCSWGAIKAVLGCVIDTENMTIQLPEHGVAPLLEILDSIPPTQTQTSVKKWHKILGELCSMSLALPGAHNIFSSMQNALSNKSGSCVNLNKGVHHALEDFWWMHDNIASHPTRNAELVALDPVAEGHHDASGSGVFGFLVPRWSLV
jgi:hypothetical protein